MFAKKKQTGPYYDLNASQHARSQAQYWDIPTLILDFNYQDYLLLIRLVEFGLNFI